MKVNAFKNIISHKQYVLCSQATAVGTRADEIQEILRRYVHLFKPMDDPRKHTRQHAAVFTAMKCLIEGLELPLNTTTHNIELMVLSADACAESESLEDVRPFTAPIVPISRRIRWL